MNTPLQLDANTTVTLAEFIPDFFIRDNQVFKRSDNPVNPAFRLMVKNTATGEESLQWLFPAYDQLSQGQKANFRFQYEAMQMGYFTGLAGFLRTRPMAGMGGLPADGRRPVRSFLHGAHAPLGSRRTQSRRPDDSLDRRPGQQE